MPTPADSFVEFRGPSFSTTALNLDTGLFNQIVQHTVTNAAGTINLKTLADGTTYDGTGGHPECLSGGACLCIQPSGSDVYFRVCNDTTAGVSAATGRLVKDGDIARLWVDSTFSHLDMIAVGASITVKTWFSSPFMRK